MGSLRAGGAWGMERGGDGVRGKALRPIPHPAPWRMRRSRIRRGLFCQQSGRKEQVHLRGK